MRDGKWYRRDYFKIDPGEQQKQTVKVKCPNCPNYQQRINALMKERDELKRLLSEKERLIIELRSRVEKLEADARSWHTERTTLLTRITERDVTIKDLEERLRKALSVQETLHITIREKETIIIKLNERIKALMDDLARKENQLNEFLRIRTEMETRITKLLSDLSRFEDQSKLIELLEEQITFCKANHITRREEVVIAQPPPPAEPVRWYYAVQNPQHAQMFQMERSYMGGDIVVDPLEGATVVNPEYYSQSERVAGNARLRVRIVSAQIPGQSVTQSFTNSNEIFVRIRLGNATQFTQPRPSSFQAISWHQDFVFVGVPTEEHHAHRNVQMSVHPLIIEVVSRVVGTASETIVGSGTIDLADLVHGLTRQCVLSLTQGGTVNVRIKALDFGLPSVGSVSAAPTQTVQHIVRTTGHQGNDEFVRAVFDLRKQDMYARMDIEDEQRGRFENLWSTHLAKTRNVAPTVKKTTNYFVSDADTARRLDAADGVIDGTYNGAPIHQRTN
jgi:hypothetical protein